MSALPTVAAATLWGYIEERERIRLRREACEPFPWTEDAILSRYKFTNVRRIHDRTTQAFLAVYQTHRTAAPHVALYNCGVYRVFGTADFAAAVGWSEKHDREALRAAVARCEAGGGQAYTGAYMVRADGKLPKVDSNSGYLSGLWVAAPRIVAAIQKERSWAAGYRELIKVRGFGGTGFMAKEVLQDFLLWLPRPVKDAATWTPVGPGARRGLNRVLGRPRDHDQPEVRFIGEVVALREAVQPKWAKTFKGADPLTAHDVQFCLCEVDKYLRAKNGEGRPRSTFRPGAAP